MILERCVKGESGRGGRGLTPCATEPTAAAIAYGLDKKSKDQKILVFDLGGGVALSNDNTHTHTHTHTHTQERRALGSFTAGRVAYTLSHIPV